MLPSLLLLALSFLAEVPLSSGLVCRHLDFCVDNHANCSAMEINVTCDAGTEFCYTLLFGNASGLDWRRDDAVLELAKGCAYPGLIYPTCERRIVLCDDGTCVDCCDGDHCNVRDPRPPVLSTPPTPPATASAVATVAVTTGQRTAVMCRSAASEGPREHCGAVFVAAMLLTLRACRSEFPMMPVMGL